MRGIRGRCGSSAASSRVRPTLVVDCYGTTLVLHNYADPPEAGEAMIAAAMHFLTERLPWMQAVVVKTRNAPTPAERNGVLRFGTKPETRVREHGVWYALDLLMQRDASFYLDTRNLRAWAMGISRVRASSIPSRTRAASVWRRWRAARRASCRPI